MISSVKLEILTTETGTTKTLNGKGHNNMKTIYEELSEERKQLQEEGQLPEWFQTAAWQTVKGRYLARGERGMKDCWTRVSKTAARHLPKKMQKEAEKKFFNLFWKGWLAGSTPVLSNMGTDRGCPVSCSGGFVSDSIGGENGFYGAVKEAAVLTKNGFGTSNYLGDIRPRGSKISAGGKASGVIPVIKDFVTMSKKVTQGTRRGAWAGYVNIDSPDFWEIADLIKNSPDDLNIGWIVSEAFIKKLDNGDKEAIAIYQMALKVKCLTGKGYFLFIDKTNKANPPMYKKHNLSVKASNLCSEITVHSSPTETFTCVLSSMNAAKYDEFKDTDAVYWATIFLDCVASEFIDWVKQRPEVYKDLKNAINFTEKHRALGLGCLGFHTYLQSKGIAFEELRASYVNNDIFKHIHDESLKASQWMAKELGEPEYCKGFGVRNTHRTCIAPNTSSAVICGGNSQGIEPVVANLWNQQSAAGELSRISPVFLKLMKEKNKYNQEVMKSIISKLGSVQHLDWLTDQEKLVFKTAYEINQEVIIRLASQRQKYICQSQSLNLFFSADEKEEIISAVHKLAFKDPYVKSLYYMRTLAGVIGSTGECVSCEG